MRPDGSIEDERLPWPASDPTAAAASLDRQLTGWASGPGSTLARHIDEGEQHPVSAHLPRHSTMSALMTSTRYSEWILRRSFVPDPHLMAAGAEHRANLLERWQREGGADVTDEIATERARAAALRASIAATTPAPPTAPNASAGSVALEIPVEPDPYDGDHDDPRADEEDPGRPDLSSYPPVDPGLGERSIAAQEWFLSDHPWAVAERTRRRQNVLAKEQQDAATIRHWVERTRGRDAVGELEDRAPGWRESLTGLADLTGPMADETHLRASIDAAEPDKVFVLAERRCLENWLISSGQREAGYQYPAHLTGPSAADFPPPGIDQTQAG